MTIAARAALAAYHSAEGNDAHSALIKDNWQVVPNNAIADIDGSWRYDDGIFRAPTPSEITYISQTYLEARLYEGVFDGDKTIILSFQGTNELASIAQIAELLQQGLGGWQQLGEVYSQFISEVLDYYDRGGFEKLIVSGHSMGGALAQTFMVNYASDARISGTDVFIGTVGSPGTHHHFDFEGWDIVNVVHNDDAVPSGPPAVFGTTRSGNTLFVERPEAAATSLVEHDQALYLESTLNILRQLEEAHLPADVSGLIQLADDEFDPSDSYFVFAVGGTGDAVRYRESDGQAIEKIVVGSDVEDVLYGDSWTTTTIGIELVFVRTAESQDVLLGGDKADTLVGGGESDVLIGGPGNDELFGGNKTLDLINEDVDVAVYPGSFRDYVLQKTLVLRNDVVKGGRSAGTDELHQIELLQFDDGILDLRLPELEALRDSEGKGFKDSLDLDRPEIEAMIVTGDGPLQAAGFSDQIVDLLFPDEPGLSS